LRIAIDAMGGDHAPKEIVAGTLEVAPKIQGSLVLVGDPSRIEHCLNGSVPRNVDIHPATEVVDMDDKPLEAIRKKKDSSLAVGVNLVKEGLADAFVSAGNTGAVTASSVLSWRQIEGVHRPAIASPFPNRHGQFLLLDAGASPDVDPVHLLEFALMGRAYAEKVMGRKQPKVHLLNIGEEPGKGNAFAKQAYELLSGHQWFAGNIEGKDMFHQPCDVVVCDAFVGNIVLKTAEGVGEFIMDEIKKSVPSDLRKLMFLPLKKALAPLRRKVDYAEYGGSPLLGLNGLCIICHGRSNAKAIRNAVQIAATAVENGLVPTIRDAISHERKLM
jgi:glycerol-3-phosphate acyltransferase PlsX